MDKFIQLTLTGLTNGAVLALVALGFVLIYKASDVINFAQGDFLMVGAYLTYGFVVQFGIFWPVGVLLTMAAAVLLGIVVERFILRPMIGEPIISVIMVTIGLSSVIRAVVNAIWGTTGRAFPSFLPDTPVEIMGAIIPADRLIALGLVIVLIAAFMIFFRFSKEGIAMRATADDQQAALSMGISVKKVFAMAWSIGGLVIGLLEVYTAGYTPPELGLATVVPFIVLILILMVKPYGLFGEVRIERV
jgi:branched-chain amino acid transport system permease protein